MNADTVTTAPIEAKEQTFKSPAMERDAARFDRMHAALLVDYPKFEPNPEWPIPPEWPERINEYGLEDETDSPIERHMLRALFVNGALDREGVPPVILRRGQMPYKGIERAQIVPQLRVGAYRADIAVAYWRYGGFARLIVECDGHEWHQLTKEQAASDKRRDRKLLAAGWPVMRFTGSEIASNAASCAVEVSNALSGLQWEVVTGYRAGLAALHRKQREQGGT